MLGRMVGCPLSLLEGKTLLICGIVLRENPLTDMDEVVILSGDGSNDLAKNILANLIFDILGARALVRVDKMSSWARCALVVLVLIDRRSNWSRVRIGPAVFEHQHIAIIEMDPLKLISLLRIECLR